MHRYLYVGASPVSRRDPNGLFGLTEFGTLLGMMGTINATPIPSVGSAPCREGEPGGNNFAVFQKDGGVNASGGTDGTLFWVASPWNDAYRRDLRHFCNCAGSKGKATGYSAFSGGDQTEEGGKAPGIPSNYPLGADYYVTLSIVEDQFDGITPIPEGIQRTTVDVNGVANVMLPPWGRYRARVEGADGHYYIHDPVPPDRNTHGCLGTTTAFMERLYGYAGQGSGKFHVIVSKKTTCLSQ
jgi:hypothetical protein